ncbi:hypothetical protein C4577_03385 [Candidatus Parcubacteria bacterium]|nr:MAG: hypothetical protein C4577_03385 [Candidatus Parcubacteria bacterium]
MHKTFWFPIFSKGFLIGVFGLSSFYFLLLFAVTRDLLHPFNQFQLFQPWMSFLIIGFGIQTGLFWLMRNGFCLGAKDIGDAGFAAGTGTAVSGVAMVACCAHHAVDILPILGVSAATLFLSEYQEQLLIFGVVTNFLGIVMMTWFISGKPKTETIVSFITDKIRSAV